MMGREVPATAAITRVAGDGSQQTIFACPAHTMRTIARLGGQQLDVHPADSSVHGCKGCLDDWPTDAQLTG